MLSNSSKSKSAPAFQSPAIALRHLLVWLGLLAASSFAVGQQSAGSIAGVVKDGTGAVIPNVTVEASSPSLIDKSRTTTTDSNGAYRIVDLYPGDYSIKFSAQGFGTVTQNGI